MRTKRTYSLLNDPMYYLVVGFFAALATALPAALQQTWMLPIAQTVILWVLALMAWRRGSARGVMVVLALWVVVQLVTMLLLASWVGSVENALQDSFNYRMALQEWLFADGALPASWASQPLPRVVELLGVTIGSTFSGGLAGIWFLVRSVNLLAYGAATMWNAAGTLAGLAAGLQPWWILRLGAYIGLIAIFALPGYTGQWNPARWSAQERRLLWGALLVLLAALALEWLLAPVWAGWLGGVIRGQ